MPKVSVIVPVYNIEKYVRECVDSILSQTYTDFEVILVDDGSTDGSPAICEEYASIDQRVKVIHKPNGGLTSARNAGLYSSTGEWIMHVDGDDWINSEAIQELIAFAENENSELVLVDHIFEYIDRSSIHHSAKFNKQGSKGLNDYITNCWNFITGSIHQRKLYFDNNIESPQSIQYCEDFHVMTRLCFYAKNIRSIGLPLYHYRQREDSIVHSFYSSKRIDDEVNTCMDLIKFFGDRNVLEDYEQTLSWRLLKATKDMVLDISKFNMFLSVYPRKGRYIFRCPLINRKLKLIMWCLYHHLRPVASLIVKTRALIGR